MPLLFSLKKLNLKSSLYFLNNRLKCFHHIAIFSIYTSVKLRDGKLYRIKSNHLIISWISIFLKLFKW